MPLFITVCRQREMRTRGESCTFELLVTHQWRRHIGPKCIGSSPRASIELQLPGSGRARGSE